MKRVLEEVIRGLDVGIELLSVELCLVGCEGRLLQAMLVIVLV